MLSEKEIVESLKASAKKNDLLEATRLHSYLLLQGCLLENSPYIASALISVYGKCGVLHRARQVLEDLPFRGVVPWSALIAGYAQAAQGHAALDCFSQMQREGLCPNQVTFVSVLKACGNVGALAKGKQIHIEIIDRALLGNSVTLGTALVDMYGRCQMLVDAKQVLQDLPVRNVVCWNALISRYAQHELGREALDCFTQMLKEGLSPNDVTFVCLLKACGCVRDIHKGEQIHKEIIKSGSLETNPALGNALVDMYAKCGILTKAVQVLEDLPIRNVVSWNSLIGGYSQHDQGHEALNCFEQMGKEGISPNRVTFICCLKACGSLDAVDKGQQIHDEFLDKGLLENDVALATALIDMYAKCGEFAKAQEVLDGLSVRDIVSWNVLIAGYAQEGRDSEAFNCFLEMKNEGLSPNEVTMASLLKASATAGAIEMGKRVHGEIVNRGFLEKNVVLETALVDMYVKCGEFAKAQELLGNIHIQDIVLWNAVISGYAQIGQGQEALNCVAQMWREGFAPDEVTYSSILKACGSTGAIAKGKQIHNEILSNCLLEKNIVLGNALIDMYVKCGEVGKAQQVLEELPVRGIVSWSALISGFAQDGDFHEASTMFTRMLRDGISPDKVTLLCLLNACNQLGKLDEAQSYYENMAKNYGITPKLEHHTCMVTAFGRLGLFGKALSVIKSISPVDGTSAVWLALLTACRKWGNVKLGKLAFDQIIGLDNHAIPISLLTIINNKPVGTQDDDKRIDATKKHEF